MRNTLKKTSRKSPTYKIHSHEVGVVTEASLKLFFSLFVGLVAIISLARLLPYHFAQSGKLKELKAQVKETEQRVSRKRQQLQQNLDIGNTKVLMEQHSPKIGQNRVRLFWQSMQNEAIKDENQIIVEE